MSSLNDFSSSNGNGPNPHDGSRAPGGRALDRTAPGNGAGNGNGNGAGALSPSFSLGALPPGSYPLGSYPPVTGDDDDTVDLSRYGRALKRRWSLVLKTLGAVLALGALWTLLQKPIYQSSATLLVTTPGGSGANLSSGSALFSQLLGSAPPASSLGQQLIIIQSPGVTGRAINRLDPAEQEAIKRFNKTDIAPLPGADAIGVQVQARDAKAAGDYANAICDEFRAQTDQQNLAQVADATRQAKDQLDNARRELERASNTLRQFQQNNNSIDLDTETKALLTQIDATQATIRATQTDRTSAGSSLATTQEQLRHLPAYSPNSVVPTPEVEALRSQLIKLRLQRNEQLRQFTPTSRVIRDIDTQIAGVQAQLRSVPKTQVGGLSPNGVRAALLQRQADLQGQIRSDEARLGSLGTQLSALQAKRAQLPSRTSALSEIKLDQSNALAAYTSWNEKYRTLSAQAQLRNVSARLLTPAEAGTMISPRRGFNLFASAFLGLLLGVALALLSDRLDDRVHGGDEAESATPLPILGRIPRLSPTPALVGLGGEGASGAGASGAGLATPSELALVEAFRLLRANIAFAGLDEPPRTLAVTSARSGEGKSTVAFYLARVLAASGAPTLLVDCDLRRPGVHSLAHLPNEKGLADVIAGGASLGSALQEMGTPNLRVLTSGAADAFSVELLDSPQGRAVLSGLRSAAQFVVFDCPPTLGLADAHIVGAFADATLLVVECEATKRRDLARAHRSLAQTGAHVLGQVLNKAPLSREGNDSYFQLPSSEGTASALVGANSRANGSFSPR